MDDIKTKNFTLVTYIDSEETLQKRLLSRKTILAYAYILHDKDIDVNGKLKPKHFHICLILRGSMYLSYVRKWFEDVDIEGKKINCLAQKTIDNKAVFEYLTHKNKPEKHRYEDNDVVTNDFKRFYEVTNNEDNAYQIVEDLVSGLPISEMCKIYGREFIYHYQQFKMVARDIKYYEPKTASDMQKYGVFYDPITESNVEYKKKSAIQLKNL